MTTPIFDAIAGDHAEHIEALLYREPLPTDPAELVYALGNTGECRPCHEGRHAACEDDGQGPGCECRRGEAGCSGPNGRGVGR